MLNHIQVGFFLMSILLTPILNRLIAQSDIPTPTPAQLAWQEAEMGAIFHYDLHVFDGKEYRQSGTDGNRINPVWDYQIFRPDSLDTDQWIKAAKDAGCTFALFTATHETGFAMYQSDVNPYSMKALKWRDGKGDLVRDFVNSCRKYDVKPGIYLGIRWNSFFGVYDFKVDGDGDFAQARQEYYNHMVEGMVTEICTRYGDLFEIWFDGGASHPDKGAPDVYPIVTKYQPNAIFYHNEQHADVRWGGSETGKMPYPCWATFPNFYSHAGDTPQERYAFLKHGDPEGKYWMPAMADAPLRGTNGGHDWFWEPNHEDYLYSLEDLMDIYTHSVGHNSTLIMGLTPDPRGLMPDPDVRRLKEWGDEINKRYGSPLAQTSGRGSSLTIQLDQKTTVTAIIISEDIRLGERVRAYTLEALIGGQWKKIGEGSSIGHKRIQLIDPVRSDQFRLRIDKKIAEPHIKNFALYDIK